MYITPADFTFIKASELGQLSQQSTDPATAQQRAINVALDEIVSHLTGRYDVQAELAKTGDARNQLLVTRACDLALYHLYAIIAPRNIPDLRRDRYLEAVELLKAVGKGSRFLALDVIPTEVPDAPEPEQGYYLWTSREKFTF